LEGSIIFNSNSIQPRRCLQAVTIEFHDYYD